MVASSRILNLPAQRRISAGLRVRGGTRHTKKRINRARLRTQTDIQTYRHTDYFIVMYRVFPVVGFSLRKRVRSQLYGILDQKSARAELPRIIMCKMNDQVITNITRAILALAPRRTEARFVSPNANFDSYLYFISFVLNTRYNNKQYWRRAAKMP
jgi:hypothetical protein